MPWNHPASFGSVRSELHRDFEASIIYVGRNNGQDVRICSNAVYHRWAGRMCLERCDR